MKYLNLLVRNNLLFTWWIVLISIPTLLCGEASSPGILKMTVDSPNIILINVDDLGWRDVGIYGSPSYLTPHIDALAKDGMRFTNAYASAANCAPSRACMMTGLQTARHGIYTVGNSDRGNAKDRKLIPVQNTTILADSFITIAEFLKSEGYVSATMGKWHLGKNPLTQGFDINIGGNTRGAPRTYYSPYKNPDLDDGMPGEYLTDRLTNEAISFLERNHRSKFFLYLPFFSIHTPLMGRKDLLKKNQEKKFHPRQSNPDYAAMVECVDENIGRILKKMNDLGLDENTLIIFTSDNGGICAQSIQSPLRAGKGSYYEGGIRVPLIVSWKNKIRSSSICNVPVTNLDFFPTIKELVGSTVTTTHPLDGQSLLPLLLGESDPIERSLYWHFPVYLQKYNGILDDARDTLFRTRPGTVVRHGDWKLHRYYEDDGLELYNLSLDPGERNNLIEDYPNERDHLLQLMEQWIDQMHAPIPVLRNPEYGS